MAAFRFISDKSEFDQSMGVVGRVFLPDRRFPERVFRANYGGIQTLDADFVVGAAFWEWLSSSPLNVATEDVLVIMLDPDPDAYFRRHYGTYGAFEISGKATPIDYWTAISEHPKENVADAFAFRTNVIAIVPRSLEWAVWADRGFNPSAIAFRDTPRRHELGGHWQPIESMIEGALTLEFEGGVVPPDVADQLIRNYSS